MPRQGDATGLQPCNAQQSKGFYGGVVERIAGQNPAIVKQLDIYCSTKNILLPLYGAFIVL
jgi:hypothetical protein